MSCSSKRKIAVGSCISTFVSSTKRRRWMAGRVAGFCATAVPVAAPDSERLRRFKDFLRVTVHLHLAPLLAQDAFGIEQERAALDAHEFPTIHAFFADHVEQPAQLAIDVRHQLEGKLLLGLELLLRGKPVLRRAEDTHPGPPEPGMQIAEL